VGVLHCSVLRSAFTNINSPIGKNVRLCALKYGIGVGDVGCWSFSKEVFVQRFIYGLPREVFAWSNFACEALLHVRACCGLVHTVRNCSIEGRIFTTAPTIWNNLPDLLKQQICSLF